MADTRREEAALLALFADNTAGDISAQDGRDVIVSESPAKVIQTGTVASIPATGRVTGDLYLPSDGFYGYRYDGSNWKPWGPIHAFTEPINGDFAWVNQGGASVTTTNGGICLRAPVSASANLRIRKKATPTPPYTIVAAFLPQLVLANFHNCGLIWRESGTGKLTAFHYDASASNTIRIYVQSYSNPTTFLSTDSAIINIPARQLVWMKIEDDNTNRKYHLSADGINWIQFYSASRTAVITPNEVGFFAQDLTNTYEMTMTLLSWKEA